MCGLVGYIQTKDLIVEGPRYGRFFKKALYLDAVRGMDSTGVLKVDNHGKYDIHKKSLPAADFLEDRRVDNFLKIPTNADYVALLGHNRAATRGKVTSANAHPFEHNGLVLMHNGTLITHRGLENKFDVDSENICYALASTASEKDVKEILENLDGAYTLVWFDYHLQTINFARNTERPLCFLKTLNGFLYASEAWMIYGGMSEPFTTEISTAKGNVVQTLSPGVWSSYDINEKKFRDTPFVPFVKPPTQIGATHGGTTNVTNINYQNVSYNDKARKEILDSLGIQAGDTVLLKYVGHYPSQVKDNKGVPRYIMKTELVSKAVGFSEEYTCTLYNQSQTDIDDVTISGLKYLVGTVTGAWKSDKGDGLYCSQSMPMYTEEEFKNASSESSPVLKDDSIYVNFLLDIVPEGNEENNSKEYLEATTGGSTEFYDNTGSKISRAAFKKLCKTGCAWCGNPIDMDNDSLVWEREHLFHEDCIRTYDEEGIVA